MPVQSRHPPGLSHSILMLRRRNTAGPSGHPSNDPILDDQEQEELIETLRQSNERTNLLYVRLVQLIVSMAILLQLTFLVNTRRHFTPLSTIFPSSSPRPLIPLPSFWTFLSIVYHLRDIVLLNPNPVFHMHPLVYSRHMWAIVLVSPCISIALRKDLVQSAWWCLPALLSILPAAVRFWIVNSQKEIDTLDGLKYRVKGA
ncbi:hypothetical protein BS47DRAFT_1490210 [Hydnum rufescens UP504]|uniref:Uncharacterized protein n=1 Tax=Hydnum rufescens UP504 TaxID=1448309 RepID=A0A9P6AED4_9AGAM|nr:hypothetical protein BS47DRAFT_1490210 [Hydnum rufescens UP504]